MCSGSLPETQLPLLSLFPLWSRAKHQNPAFKKTWSAFHFLSPAWGATTPASYMKEFISPKNNFSFKCPLQRGWNNLSSALWRQKKVIAWVSHYLQQGKRERSLYRSSRSSNGMFPACGLWKKAARFRCGNLWARHARIISTSHADWAVIRYNPAILGPRLFSGFFSLPCFFL